MEQIRILLARDVAPLIQYTPGTVSKMYQDCPERLPPAIQRPVLPGAKRRPAPIWLESTVLEWLKSHEVQVNKPETGEGEVQVRLAGRRRGRPRKEAKPVPVQKVGAV